MEFLNSGFSIGQYWGITVRLHFTFILFALWRATHYSNLAYGLAVVIGFWFCILLHEFGHALAARWCDGECDDILLWPLGGLAYCRPAFHPTAHLITTVAGPFVTLVLWLLFTGLFWLFSSLLYPSLPGVVYRFTYEMKLWNGWLLAFNLLPAFPMDGGRMLRDILWHKLSAEKATAIAVRLSQVMAITAAAWGIYRQGYWLIFLACFVLVQAANEKRIVGFEAGGSYEFSLRERLRRGSRRRAFHRAIKERTLVETTEPFHRCAACGKTEHAAPYVEFRVCDQCSHGEEYCPDHLDNHAHA